jgi:hypothetical protein
MILRTFYKNILFLNIKSFVQMAHFTQFIPNTIIKNTITISFFKKFFFNGFEMLSKMT